VSREDRDIRLKTVGVLIIISLFTILFIYQQARINALEEELTALKNVATVPRYVGNPFGTELWPGQLQAENITGMHWYSYNPSTGQLVNRTDWILSLLADRNLNLNGYSAYGASWVNASRLLASQQFWLGSNNRTDVLAYPEQSASYIIFKDGSVIKAKNCAAGKVEFSGTDAATVINSAIAAGKMIFIKAGTYDVSTWILPGSSTSVFGEGDATILRYANGANLQALFEVYGKTDVRIENLKIDGNRAQQSSGYGWGIEFDGATRCSVKGVYLYDMRGAAIQIGGQSSEIEVSGCKIESPYGISIANRSTRITVANNLIDSLGLGGECISLDDANHECVITGNVVLRSTSDGILIQAGTNGASRRNVVANNYVANCSGAGIRVVSSDYADVKGNVLYANAYGISLDGAFLCNFEGNIIIDSHTATNEGEGFHVVNGAHDNVIQGNIVRGGDRQAMIFYGAGDRNSILNNRLIDNGRHGIFVGGPGSFNHYLISGNMVSGAPSGYSGIYLGDDTNNALITGNKCTGNARYGIEIGNTACDNNVIEHNDLRGNTLGALLNGGTGTIIIDNPGYNPQAASTPSVPASPATFGPYAYPMMVVVYGGTVTDITVRGLSTGLTSGTFYLYPGDTIVITYTATPTVKLYPQ